MKTEKKTRQNKFDNLLSYYDEENSRNENPASWEIAGTENTLCVKQCWVPGSIGKSKKTPGERLKNARVEKPSKTLETSAESEMTDDR